MKEKDAESNCFGSTVMEQKVDITLEEVLDDVVGVIASQSSYKKVFNS